MTVEEEIKKFIAENILFSVNGFSYADDASFLDQGIIDSIGIMQLVMFVEEHYKLNVRDSDITPSNFDSVQRLSSYIRSQVK